MIEKYIIDKTDIHRLLIGEELALPQGCKARAFCVEVLGELTNGDVIKAMFPGAVFTDSMVEGYVCSIECHLIGRDTKRMYFDVDWWNAPYQKEVEE